MKVVFDESGNTGCVTAKSGKLNFKTQPLFSMVALLIRNDLDEKNILLKYNDWKKQYNIDGEIKGSDLMTKANNAKLIDFVDNFLDDTHFSLIIYDKKFYLSSLLHNAMLGTDFQYELAALFFQQVSMLSFEDDDYFIKYCETVEDLTIDSLNQFLEFIKEYNYRYMLPDMNAIKEFATMALKDGKTEKWLSGFMTHGWYDNLKHINVINLNALGELILEIKIANPKLKNKEMVLIHDNTQEFEKMIAQELKDFKITFADSKNNQLVQIADNVASIVNKVFALMIQVFREQRQWHEENEWVMELAAKILNKIGTHNIKFTVPISDWAVAFCVAEMFTLKFPKQMRKNLYFNPLYMKWQSRFMTEIESRAVFGDKAMIKKLLK